MAKKPRTRKYSPNRTMAKTLPSLYKKYIDNVWVADSSVQEKITFHNASIVRGSVVQPPPEVMRDWIISLNEKEFPWRFMFFGIDLVESTYVSKIFTYPDCKTREMQEQINEKLKEFMEENNGKIDSWAWIAIPSDVVDIDAMEDSYMEHFDNLGIFDAVKVENMTVLRRLASMEKRSLR